MSQEDLTSEEVDNLSDDEIKELMEGDYGYPKAPEKDNLYKFFREVLKSQKSHKVANFSEAEMGVMKLPVRGYMEIAAYARAEGLSEVAKYLDEKAEILAATSMGRKGFWAQLLVTQIKKEQKVPIGLPQKKNWLGKPKVEAGTT